MTSPMKEGMEGVWKEVWRDPERFVAYNLFAWIDCTVFLLQRKILQLFFSVKRDTEPRPIRGFLRDPDFRRGRDPLTGREGYSTIYEARKKVNTLVSRLLIG